MDTQRRDRARMHAFRAKSILAFRRDRARVLSRFKIFFFSLFLPSRRDLLFGTTGRESCDDHRVFRSFWATPDKTGHRFFDVAKACKESRGLATKEGRKIAR